MSDIVREIRDPWMPGEDGIWRSLAERAADEIERLHGRIEELEIAFAHYHTPENIGSSDPPSDKCKQCGFDIRDQIHLRVDDLRIGARR